MKRKKYIPSPEAVAWTMATMRNILYRAKIKKDWNQKALADNMKVTEGFISGLKNGHTCMSIREVKKFARVIGEDYRLLLPEEPG